MSKHVRSKDPTQCRSHHQKMVEKYKAFENLSDALLYSSETNSGIQED